VLVRKEEAGAGLRNEGLARRTALVDYMEGLTCADMGHYIYDTLLGDAGTQCFMEEAGIAEIPCHSGAWKKLKILAGCLTSGISMVDGLPIVRTEEVREKIVQLEYSKIETERTFFSSVIAPHRQAPLLTPRLRLRVLEESERSCWPWCRALSQRLARGARWWAATLSRRPVR
jgi:hypothetical protein